MSRNQYLPGELFGIETARKRGYVATIRHDDDLAMDWYGFCRAIMRAALEVKP